MKAGTLLNAARVALCACIFASAALVIDYQNPGDPAFCAVQSSCYKVRISPVGTQIAEILGHARVRLPDVARALFLLMLAASFFIKRWRHLAGLAVASGIGALFALYLIYAQSSIDAYCAYCMVVDVAMLAAAGLLAGAAWLTRKTPPSERAAATDPAFSSILHAGDTPVTIAWGFVGALVTVIPLIWSHYPKNPPLPEELQTLQEPGKTTIIAFTDFQCPHCRNLHEKALRELEHKDDVVIKRFMVPLPFHVGAMPAALVYTCTPEDKRNAVADALYAAPPEQLGYDTVVDLAVSAGVESAADLRRCISLDETKVKIDQDRLLFFGSLGGEGLPTTWVGRTMVKGAQPDNVKAAYSRTSGVDSAFFLPVWAMFAFAGSLAVAVFGFAELWARRARLRPAAEAAATADSEAAAANDAEDEPAAPPAKKKKKKRAT